MKRFVGFMMIVALPLLCVIHSIALIICVPFLVVHATTISIATCLKELFDLRNTYAFAKGLANQAWNMMKGTHP